MTLGRPLPGFLRPILGHLHLLRPKSGLDLAEIIAAINAKFKNVVSTPLNLSKTLAASSPPIASINPLVASYALNPQSIKVTSPFSINPAKSVIKSPILIIVFINGSNNGSNGINLIAIKPTSIEVI